MMFFLIQSGLANPSALTSAMEVPVADIQYENLSAHSSATEVSSSLGIISPTDGSSMAQLYTGSIGTSPQPGIDLGYYGSQGYDQATLTLNLLVPPNQNSFSFDFNFLSAEYPEFVGMIYNDTFEANITGSAFTGNAAIDSLGNMVNVNSALFTVTSPQDLQNTGFGNGDGGGTGWLTILIPVNPNDQIQIQFTIYDMGDGVYDSTVLLDNFSWSEADISVPSIIVPIDIERLSPKRGSTNGDQTTIYGDNFNPSCEAFVDDIPVSTTYIDNTTLDIITPPHAAGLVDVKVSCTQVDDVLVGGYTYFDSTNGEYPPVILGVDPYQIYHQGGTEISVVGENFELGSEIIIEQNIDGVPTNSVASANYIADSMVTFQTPVLQEGIADITIRGPTGLQDTRMGALIVMHNAHAEIGSNDTGMFNDTGSGVDGMEKEAGIPSCSSFPIKDMFGPLLLPLLFLRIKRRD
jgi:hypothetical protein